MGPRYAVVIPTVGRDSLQRTLSALAESGGPAPEEIVVVDDRADPEEPVRVPELPSPVRMLRSGGRGPAAARNVGWREVSADWVVFLDDDVVPEPGWAAALRADLADLPAEVAGSQGDIVVPLPHDRRPTDWERSTAGLMTAQWITADMAYRRAVLAEVGGFDERFPRAYREDADLAGRVRRAGHRLAAGSRRTTHPVRPAGFLASVRVQVGNADNALLRRRYGRNWRRQIGEGPGLLPAHVITTLAAATTVLLASARRRAWRLTGLLWTVLTTRFAIRRILPGPRTPTEIGRMVVTSIAIPPAACLHRLRGELRWRKEAGIP